MPGVTMTLMAATPYEKTMNRALNLLSFKPRSVAEMRGRLMEKEWAEEPIVEQVIARLIELRYLDDEQFAASYASSRLSVRPIGRTRLRHDLQRKKLPNEVTEQTIDEIINEANDHIQALNDQFTNPSGNGRENSQV